MRSYICGSYGIGGREQREWDQAGLECAVQCSGTATQAQRGTANSRFSVRQFGGNIETVGAANQFCKPKLARGYPTGAFTQPHCRLSYRVDLTQLRLGYYNTQPWAKAGSCVVPL